MTGTSTYAGQKPLLLLDVDGVLNAFAPTRPHTVRYLGGRYLKDGTWAPYKVHLDNEIAEMIDLLAEHYEIHWATMWNGRANEVGEAIGIDPLPHMYCDHFEGWDAAKAMGMSDFRIKGLWYAKTPLIPAYVNGRPFAWVDDDHTHEDRAFLKLQPGCETFLLLQTNDKTGLTWDNVATLIDWAEKVAYNTLSIPARRIAA